MGNADKLDLSPKTEGTRTEDSLLAEQVAERLDPGRYAWVAGLGWLHNTGTYWEETSNEALVEAVRLELKAIVIEEVGAGAEPKRLGDLGRLLGSGKIRAVAGLVRGILECRADSFDTAKDHLNTPTGIVDLRTGDLLPHGSDFRFTKVTAAAYRPRERSDDWDAALEAVPAGVRDYLQVRLGQALTGYPSSDDKLLVLQGGGENGKSTVLDAVRAALGSFAGIVPDRVLTANAGDHPTELTMFRGLRLAILEELPEGARFSIKRLKDSVGSTTMTARKIAKDNITWETTHSLFVTTNYYPRINETDNGTWRRLELLRFPYTFRRPGVKLRTDDDRRGDPQLRIRLRRAPSSAVLAWLVEGARRWYEDDRYMPTPPKRVQRDTLTWRKQTDLILAFVSEEMVFRPDSLVLASELLDRFSAWLIQNGHREWSAQTFAARFAEHSIIREHSVKKTRKRVDGLVLSHPNSTGPHLRSTLPTTGNLHVWSGLAWR